jgi:aspartyl-tRNA(Asn)/glutamyl-tRNA(Gln) amidotransferase subunit A
LSGWRIGVVRHFWEEDLPASDEEHAAMRAALDVLRNLGATLEDIRLRSLQEYFDVKIIVAESEIHSVHQRDLQQRPGDFGADFMGKILLACLFSASDYVQAQRTRRRMLEEMEPIYARYDVLVTAGMSPAPRFADVRIIDFWEKPNMTTPFSVTAGPALSLCNGYTKGGLPMSMQITGRPFDEVKVLRAGYAYERATTWRQRRPQLTPGTPRVAAGPSTDNPTDPSRYDAKTRELVLLLLARHGLTKVSDAHVAQLCEAVPYGLAMAERVRRNLRREDEPANSFRLPRSTLRP